MTNTTLSILSNSTLVPSVTLNTSTPITSSTSPNHNEGIPRWMSSFVFMVSVSVALSLLILVAIIGNSFVIAAFCLKRRLRKPSNYFILNLAVTDLSLAVLILPISAVYDVTGKWVFGEEVCLIWTVMDVFISTISILSLVAISADRYMAISNSLMYPKLITGKRVALIVAMVYFISLTISMPPVLGWGKQQFVKGVCSLPYSPGYVIYSAIGSFYLPFIVMSVLYCKIYKVAKTHMRSIKKRSVVGSLLDIGEMERSDRSLFFSDDKNMNRRLTSSSSGYSSSKPTQRFSQTSRSTTDTLHQHHVMSGSRFSLAKQDSSDTLMVPGQRGRYLFISPMSSRSSRSSGSVSDFDQQSLAVPRDSMRSSRSSSSSYGGDMESDLIRDYFKQNLVIPRASYASNASSNNSRTKRSPISRRIKRFVSERKAAKTVSIIVGAFMICWTPFSIVYLLNGICKEQCGVSDTVFKICFWLGYVNSVLNPIIYSMYNRDMKSALLGMLAPLCCLCCARYSKQSRHTTKTSSSIGSFVSIGDSDWQYDDSISVADEALSTKPADKHLNRQVRQSMPTATCPVQVYINEPRKSRAGSVVSWSMAALRGTLHDRLSELDRQSNEDGLSVQSEKSVVLPAVSFSLGAGDEGDTESQASTLERCYPQQHYHRDNRSSLGMRRRSSVSADDFSPHHLRELSGIPHTHTGISPRSQRRRSSAAIFLSPDAESSWSRQVERDFARRSSKIPSLEDIQETLSQDTRRSSDETGNNVTRQNSFDQVRNASFDGTSSANSTLQDSRKSSAGGLSNVCGLTVDSASSTLPLIHSPGEVSPHGRSESPEDDNYYIVPPIKKNSKRKLSGNSQSDRSPDSNTNSLCARDERLSPRRSRERIASPTPQFINNAGSPTEGIVVTLIQDPDSSVSAYKTLCLSINPNSTQQIQNIQIVFNPSPIPAPAPVYSAPHSATPTMERYPPAGTHMGGMCNERRENMDFVQSMPPSFANSLKPTTDEARLQKASSDSCLLSGHVTNHKSHDQIGSQDNSRLVTQRQPVINRGCASAPAVRKLYQKTSNGLLDSPDESVRFNDSRPDVVSLYKDTKLQAGIPQSTQTDKSSMKSNSTLSSLALDTLFDSLESDDVPPSETTTSTDMWSRHNLSIVEEISCSSDQAEQIWRSKSEPILTNTSSYKTITPKYAKYLQGFINTKHKGRRRDSIISRTSLNTDYNPEENAQAPSIIGTEYEGCSQRSSLISNSNQDTQADDTAPSVCGTEYEGDNSQRSSLTSNQEEITVKADVHATYDDMMVPAIHVTETDDITTVIQAASTKFLSFKSRGKSKSQPNMGDRVKPGSEESSYLGSEARECRRSSQEIHGTQSTGQISGNPTMRSLLLEQAMLAAETMGCPGDATRELIEENLPNLQTVLAGYIRQLMTESNQRNVTLPETNTHVTPAAAADVSDEVIDNTEHCADDTWV